MNLFTDKRCPIWGLISDSDSQSKPPLEPQEDLQTWGHQLHHSVRFGDSSRTQKQSGPAPLDDSQDLQTVGNQPPHSVRLRDLFSDSDATLSRYSGAPGRPLAATTPFLGHRPDCEASEPVRPLLFTALEEVLQTAGELEGAHLLCVLDLCHLGGDRVEALLSKVYRVT
ncbi:unnamed protein product [Boreogadus saida]